MKPFLLTAAALLATTAVRAASITETYGPFTPGTLIPDNDPVLTPHLTSVTTSLILSLTEVEVSFELRGTAEGEGFASDLFASLLRSPVGDTPTVSDPAAVLLNRVGITDMDPVGFGYDGWTITLKDSAATDIHSESLVSGVLTGSFQPDGRLAPTDAGRPALLSVFNGLAGNGDWHLNVGDLAETGTMQLVSWSLTLTGEDTISAVPEAGTWAAGFGLAALAGAAAGISRNDAREMGDHSRPGCRPVRPRTGPGADERAERRDVRPAAGPPRGRGGQRPGRARSPNQLHGS